jgi:hypothetical protein
MIFANPYKKPGQWYKGNLHTHSTNSDAMATPEQVIDFYRARDYHFMAFTEHRLLTPTSRPSEDFLIISGVEVDATDPLAGVYHLNALGLKELPKIDFGETFPMNEAVSLIRAVGGKPFLCHPYWSQEMSKDLLRLQGCFGIEVWNGACEAWDCKGLSVVHWDDMLNAGMRIWGLGTDDCHWWPGREDAGLGWVWVKAAELSEPAILEALEAGYFYASSGPQIHDLNVEGDQIHVRCSPVKAIDFIGTGFCSRREMAPPGETITEATFTRDTSSMKYLRVSCLDLQGNVAWSNPIFF